MRTAVTARSARVAGAMIRVTHPPDTLGVDLSRGTGVIAPYPRHWHEEYHLCLIEHGPGELYYRGSFHSQPNVSLCIVHPGEMHSNRPLTNAGCTFRNFNAAPKLVAGDSKALPFFPQTVVLDRAIIRQFARLHKAWEHDALRLERDTLLVEFFAALRARYASGEPAPLPRHTPAVRRVRDYLADHTTENPSLQQLARVGGLSAFHLLRLFRAETGMPPHAWLAHARIVRARRLLARGWEIAHVAAETGFSDQSHLTRRFKALTGITPGVFRRKGKNVQDRRLIVS